MGAVTVGIDIGTTSVKALAVDDAGHVVASVRRPHALTAGPHRLAHDADAAWRQGALDAFAAVARGQDVRSVAVAAMVPSLTAVDVAGRPCGPGLLYGDGRGGPTDEALGFLRWLAAERPDAHGFWPAQAVANHALCGRAAIDYATAYCLAPLFDGTGWTQDAARLPTVIADPGEPAGRLNDRLAEMIANPRDPSGSVPAVPAAIADPVEPAGRFDDRLAAAIADPVEPGGRLDDRLAAAIADPREPAGPVPAAPAVIADPVEPAGRLDDRLVAAIADPVEPGGRLDDRLAAAIADPVEPVGRLDGGGPLVGAGTVDALAAQYVAGADEPGDVLVLLGATLIVWLVVPEWIERPGLWTVPHTTPGRTLVGGASNAGALFLDWATRLRPDERGDLDPHDVPIWLPYVRGERTPLHDPTLRSRLEDLHLGHGPAALERAAQEATGFVVRHVLDLAGAPARRIVAAGGGVRREGWVRALADTTGLPVDVAAVADATALGTAFLARCVAGLEARPADGHRWSRTARRVEPDPKWSAACTPRYRRFRALTAAALEDRS